MKDVTREASSLAIKGVRDMRLYTFWPFFFTYTEMAGYKDWQMGLSFWNLKLIIGWHVSKDG